MASSQVPNNVTLTYPTIGYADVTYGTKLRFRGNLWPALGLSVRRGQSQAPQPPMLVPQ